MYYSKEDAEKAVKVLYFEGAGCVERGDVENCRIRTAFVNDEGKRFYLELWGIEVTKNSPERYKAFENAGVVDYCYILSGDDETICFDIEQRTFEYSKQGILEFVNDNLHCSFDEIKVLDIFDGYRVHKDGGGNNFIEDYEHNEARAEARRKAYNKIDMEIREKLGERFSKIGLFSKDDESITVRCYASDEAMKRAGLTERKITIKVDY